MHVAYSSEFYKEQFDGSKRSAAIVVPLVLSLARPRSVVDVGCGLAPWAAEFLARGVPRVLAVDGSHVDPTQLQVPSSLFVAHDLAKPLRLDRSFDLAVCLEVAEHLPASRAESLIADLTSLAACVLFSAAVPGQGGTNHVNEQYLPYWIELFQAHGYEGIDPIRPMILGNPAVEWWYQQNIVMFVAPRHPLLYRGFSKPTTIIHPDLYHRTCNQPSLKQLLRALPKAFVRSCRHHLHLG